MKYIIAILLFLSVMTGAVQQVYAMNTAFSTERLSEEEEEKFLANVNISVLMDEPQKRKIECFDVKENGLVVIGTSEENRKFVGVYSEEGSFQYGYEFKCDGTFGVEWNENNINIYFVRGDVAVTLNPMDEIESIFRIQNTEENNDYWHHHVFVTKRTVGDTTYMLKNDAGVFNLFASSYSKLVATRGDGEETIVYDVGTSRLPEMLVKFIGVIIFILIVVLVIRKEILKLRDSSSGRES